MADLLIATTQLRFVAIHRQDDGEYFELAPESAGPDAPTIIVPRSAIVRAEEVEAAR